MLPLPRARPFLIASSTSAFGGARSSRFGPTCADAFAAVSVWHCAAVLAEQLAAVLLCAA